jgi:vanillate/3-O-methylgallate O-demethylase
MSRGSEVLVDGKLVGCSTSRAYSTFLRRMISLCVLDREHAHDGRQVMVIWGDRDSDQREIRATVRPLPFKPDNRRIDVNQL